MSKFTQKLPVVYVQSTTGSLYRHCSVNPTLFFTLNPDEKLYSQDEDYAKWFDEILEKEVYQAIINKFIVSQPLLVTNDKIPLVLFKSNIDPYSLKEFCRAIVTEMDFHTQGHHEGKYALQDMLFMQMNKQPTFLRAANVGEKFTRSSMMETSQEELKADESPADQGIVTPFKAWKEEKRRLQQAAEEQEQEKIVEW